MKMKKYLITAFAVVSIVGLTAQCVYAGGEPAQPLTPPTLGNPLAPAGAPATGVVAVIKNKAGDMWQTICDNPKMSAAVGCVGFTFITFIILWNTSQAFRNMVKNLLGLPEEKDDNEAIDARFSYL